MLPLLVVWEVDWGAVGAIAGVAGALAAFIGLPFAYRAAREAWEGRKEAKPDVTVTAFVEKPRLRVRIVLKNTGGSRATVSQVKVVRAVGGTGYAQPEIIATVPVAPPPAPSAGMAPGSVELTLEAHDERVLTLRRVDGSKFENVDKLRALVKVARKKNPTLLVPFTPLPNERFFVEGVDKLPPPPAPLPQPPSPG